jgi:hypothetical protein
VRELGLGLTKSLLSLAPGNTEFMTLRMIDIDVILEQLVPAYRHSKGFLLLRSIKFALGGTSVATERCAKHGTKTSHPRTLHVEQILPSPMLRLDC